MGQPFEGLSRFGYDNVEKKYVSTWTDNFSTGLMIDRGSYDAKTKTWTMTGTVTDPMTGQEMDSKSVIEIEGPDKYTITAYGGPAGGELAKSMVLIYTRKAEK